MGKVKGLGMKLDKSLEPFRATIESLNRLLQSYDRRRVIIGGVAVGLLGKSRFTADVDAVFLLSTEDISRFLEPAKMEDIIPCIQNAEEFARRTLVGNHPDLGRRRIEKWVKSFAEVLEIPSLWDEVKQMLNQ